jgi:hypothetical protein
VVPCLYLILDNLGFSGRRQESQLTAEMEVSQSS